VTDELRNGSLSNDHHTGVAGDGELPACLFQQPVWKELCSLGHQVGLDTVSVLRSSQLFCQGFSGGAEGEEFTAERLSHQLPVMALCDSSTLLALWG